MERYYTNLGVMIAAVIIAATSLAVSPSLQSSYAWIQPDVDPEPSKKSTYCGIR